MTRSKQKNVPERWVRLQGRPAGLPDDSWIARRAVLLPETALPEGSHLGDLDRIYNADVRYRPVFGRYTEPGRVLWVLFGGSDNRRCGPSRAASVRYPSSSERRPGTAELLPASRRERSSQQFTTPATMARLAAHVARSLAPSGITNSIGREPYRTSNYPGAGSGSV